MKGQSEAESSTRSLFVVKDMNPGETLTNESVRSIRPGYGLHPRHLNDVVGKKTKKGVTRGTPLAWEHIET